MLDTAEPRARRTTAVAALGGALLVVLAGAGSVVLRALDGLAPSPSAVAAAAFAVTGALLVAGRRASVPGWLLVAGGAAIALANLLLDWARYALVSSPGSLPAGEAALWTGSWIWVVGYCVVLALLPLRLPTGDLPGPRWRWAWRGGVAVTAAAAVGWATTPYDRMDRPPLDDLPAGVTAPFGSDLGPVVLAVSLPLVLVATLVGLASVVVRFRRADVVERQQLKWILYGAALSAVIFVLAQTVGPDGGSDVVLAVGVLPLPVGVAVAGFRYRLWDVDLVIRRTIAYAVLTALVVGLYAVVVLGLGDALGERTGAPLLATVAVALLAEPVRVRVQRLVDRLVHGGTADPYRALVRLGDRLDAAAAEPVGREVLVRTAGAVRQVLRVPWAVLEVVDGPQVASGTPDGPGEEVTLELGGRVVGLLRVGTPPGQGLRPGDLRLLHDLAGPVAVAAHAAQLRDDLQASRERLVLAREEERRRLRHDLHDELGPVLAAAALQLGEVRSLTDQDDVRRHAVRAEELLTGALGTVRTIVDGLRPPALDDLGLTEALLAQAGSFRAGGLDVDVDVRGALDDLPAAVEVAGLRIAAEALANAARHARAGRVRLGVERLADCLEITVADDGAGFAGTPRTGVGLVSMRERAEELGGECRVESRPGGTVVTARLPVPAPSGATGSRVPA